MKNILQIISWSPLFIFLSCSNYTNYKKTRETINFGYNWNFSLVDTIAYGLNFEDSSWRTLQIPHDWSIEGEFNENNPATVGGGALPGGIGWYRKTFYLPETAKGKAVFIDFDGIYCNSEVWINENYLGKRPNGYISFRYELSKYLNYGDKKNVIAVKVDNSEQPNSRWYSGSGIYRNVWLVVTDKVHIPIWGTYITTPKADSISATVNLKTKLQNTSSESQTVTLKTIIINNEGKKIASSETTVTLNATNQNEITQEFNLPEPMLWSVENPYLYKAISQVKSDGKIIDDYITPFGVRFFKFDALKGFSLNGKPLKILGVCNHHDLGCLGAAINIRALERQLELLKDMGCNAIRTSHNPPAPELLDLCDKMGFIVMDEAFDMWKKQKNDFDYHLVWDEWHKRDLEDQVLRDRNHPSVFIWSIGNEILEQWDSTGTTIAIELKDIISNLDTTRMITSACNNPVPQNAIIKSGALDLIGYNYFHHAKFDKFLQDFPGQKFIASETTSALATRGSYDMPSDSIRRWPERWDIPFTTGNPDNTCSAYDNCSAPWGSTHEETWKVIKKHDYLSGMFIWTGFDYLGEPTPYGWPSRSSYFGIFDLAGFPKDAFYMYQSEWTKKPVLHIFPHWNWKEGDTVDIWAYGSNPEVELFLNGNSLGKKIKQPGDLHLSWRVPFVAGKLKAVSKGKGKDILTKEIMTAGKPAKIILSADRKSIKADGFDLSFITVKVTDIQGNLVPYADHMINFGVTGNGSIIGVDNGSQTSLESFKANHRKVFNGLCLAVIQATDKPGIISIKAESEGLETASLQISSY
jgi:beta-galactosidase